MDNSVQIQEIDNTVDWKDQYIRLLADYENLKKRTEKSLQAAQKRTISSLLENILPVYLSLSEGVSNGWIKDPGVVSIYKKFKSALTAGCNITPIDKEFIKENLHNEFNDNYMAAVSYVDTKSKEQHNKVFDVVVPGAVDKDDEVLVYAKVIVCRYKDE